MVKLKGPMLSNAAAGTFADLLNFSTANGRAYARKKPVPTNNKQQSQLPTRAAMSFLSKSWANLTPTEQATWSRVLPDASLSPYNTYLKLNNERILDGSAPSTEYPATPGAYTSAPLPKGTINFHRYVELSWQMNTNFEHWSMFLHRSTTSGFTPTAKTIVKMLHPETHPTYTVTQDTPPAAGTYYYKAVLGNTHGSMSTTIFGQTVVWP